MSVTLSIDGYLVTVDRDSLQLMQPYRWHVYSYGRLDRRYVKASIGGRWMYLHRLIMAAKPGEMLDHINHNGLDNRKENLRFVSHQENCWNATQGRANRSGVVGVGQMKESGRWRARIFVEGKAISLGCYATAEEAAEARLQANKLYGFHENHGRP